MFAGAFKFMVRRNSWRVTSRHLNKLCVHIRPALPCVGRRAVTANRTRVKPIKVIFCPISRVHILFLRLTPFTDMDVVGEEKTQFSALHLRLRQMEDESAFYLEVVIHDFGSQVYTGMQITVYGTDNGTVSAVGVGRSVVWFINGRRLQNGEISSESDRNSPGGRYYHWRSFEFGKYHSTDQNRQIGSVGSKNRAIREVFYDRV